MRNIQLISFVVCLLFLFLLSGCVNDMDGEIEMKEPKKELSELPERKAWSVRDAEGFDE